MATILAANTGNWSATGTWTGGVVPVAGDIVVANGKTITMDTLNIAVAELRNDTTGGATAGGTFNLVNGSNITANIYAGSAAANCVSWSGSAGQTATITGNIFAGTGNSANAVNCSTSGNLIVGGGSTVTGGASTGTAVGILFTSTGTFTFATANNPGTITGSIGVNGSSYGVNITGANCTANIFASSITSTTTGTGAALQTNGTNVLLNVVATTLNSIGCGTSGIYVNGTLNAASVITISGIIYGSNGQQQQAGIYLLGNTTVNIVHSGSCIAQNANNGCAIINGSTSGTINYTGNPVGNSTGSTFSAVANASTGTFNVTGSVTAGAIAHGANNQTTGIFRCTRAIGNGYGVGSVGISANIYAINNQNQSALSYVEELQYGPLGQSPVGSPIRFTALTNNKVIFTTTTGTFKTLVDTTATAGIVPSTSDVRSGTVYNSGNSTGTCAVPSPSSVALNVPVGNTVGTAFLNASDIRPAIGLASANLDTQLQSIPSAAQNASAVRTELTNELARVNNCATVATTGQQIQDAF